MVNQEKVRQISREIIDYLIKIQKQIVKKLQILKVELGKNTNLIKL